MCKQFVDMFVLEMCTRWFSVLQFINSDGIHQMESAIGVLNSHNLYAIIFQSYWPQTNLEVLLMEDILHRIKPCKKWDSFHINWWRISSITRTNTFQELNQRGEGQIKNITPFIPKTWSTLHLGDFKDNLWVDMFTSNIRGSDPNWLVHLVHVFFNWMGFETNTQCIFLVNFLLLPFFYKAVTNGLTTLINGLIHWCFPGLFSPDPTLNWFLGQPCKSPSKEI